MKFTSCLNATDNLGYLLATDVLVSTVNVSLCYKRKTNYVSLPFGKYVFVEVPVLSGSKQTKYSFRSKE